MDAQDRRAALEGGDGGRDARPEQVVRARSSRAQRALAREADEHRPPEREQDVEPAHELEVVRHRLAEADARVEADPLLGDALRDRERQPLLEERRDLGRDVVVARLRLHRPRLALHVHEAEVRAGAGDDSGELGIAAQRRDVVDEDRAALERSPRDRRLRGVDRDRSSPPRRLENRHDPPQLLLRGDAVRAGTRRLAADVDDRGSLRDHAARRRQPRPPGRGGRRRPRTSRA